MRFWIINHYGLAPSNNGGTRHYNFARELQSRGHEVLIIAANFNHFSHAENIDNQKTGDVDYTSEVPFLWLPVPAYKGNTLSRFWNMVMFSRQILKNKFLKTSPAPDVIIGSSPHLFAAFAAERLAHRLKKPFVLEVRDLWPESLVDLGRFTHKHPLIKVMRWLESYLYRKAKKVITLLPNAHTYFIQKGVAAENIAWIPNFVDSTVLSQGLTPKVTQQTFTVMYAGAHGVANDLDTVLKAAKILESEKRARNIRICLIGEGPEKARLIKWGEQENIRIVDFKDSVSKKEIYQVLQEADAFLMLLKDSPVFRWGISPNKLFDYLMMARPVIFGVNTPFNPIEKYQAGISIPPGDPTALADAIEKLALTSPTALMAMGHRGKAFVLQNHTLSHLTHHLEKLLTQVSAEYAEYSA